MQTLTKNKQLKKQLMQILNKKNYLEKINSNADIKFNQGIQRPNPTRAKRIACQSDLMKKFEKSKVTKLKQI